MKKTLTYITGAFLLPLAAVSSAAPLDTAKIDQLTGLRAGLDVQHRP